MTHDFPHVTRTRRASEINCTWCPERIKTGEQYVTWGQIHDGYMGRMNMHPECEAAYFESHRLYEFSPGDMERGESCVM